ncbi:MAG: hypothetical protein JJT76_12655 [Clostridiaceae bacterium]|nr:hypothetical protein [Clostridiaceae bacterium]
MKSLKGELIEDSTIIKTSSASYNNPSDFFIALVTISDNLDVDIPIWTLKEDKLLKQHKEVILQLDTNLSLRIYLQEH